MRVWVRCWEGEGGRGRSVLDLVDRRGGDRIGGNSGEAGREREESLVVGWASLMWELFSVQ